MPQESDCFHVSRFSRVDARKELWAEHPGWNVRLAWDLLTYNLLLLCSSCGIFFKDACKGFFIWTSEGEAGGVVGGYWVTLGCRTQCLWSRRSLFIHAADGGRAKALGLLRELLSVLIGNSQMDTGEVRDALLSQSGAVCNTWYICCPVANSCCSTCKMWLRWSSALTLNATVWPERHGCHEL